MADLDLDAIGARIKAATGEVNALALDHPCRPSTNARPGTAPVLHAALDDGEELLAEVKRLRDRIAELGEDAELLSALQAAGVDNWDGYSYAHEILREWQGGEPE